MHVVEQACALGAWSLLGWMTFSGRLDGGWLLAWMLLLACIVPFRLLSLAAGGRLSLEFSSSLRRRLLAGARAPQSGVLLLCGLDRHTLGRAWRRRIVLAPQFHQNHVLMGTFLYNLLLGRAWPPSPSDVEATERLCRQLDLGPLIDRMPGGLLQMVGETGWQLSHGEKSRLFLARALLQGADLVLLDETFSALDPETLSRTLPRVLDLAPTLVVIAHP